MSSRNARKRVRELSPPSKLVAFTTVKPRRRPPARPQPLSQDIRAGFLFTFTKDLRDELPVVPTSSQTTIPPAAPDDVLASRIDDDDAMEEPVHHASVPRGIGQNEMLTKWVNKHSQWYLAQMLAGECLASYQGICCARCSVSGDLFQCRDCLHRWSLCKECTKSQHAGLPSHRFRKWTGTFFKDIAGTDLELVFHLGHGGQPCNLGKDTDFLLGDANGFHQIRIRTCSHAGRGSTARQLLDAGIFPCTESQPSTGFTFSVLRLFHLLAAEAKVPTQRFYNVLVFRTNAMFPDKVPNRYREFARVVRQWQYLQDLRRSGTAVTSRERSAPGDLALRCPACPRLGVNFLASDVVETDSYIFVFHVSYDGSFQLFRKAKAHDEWDICLSDGRKYFVEAEGYRLHLEGPSDQKRAMTTRDADCNNHKAAETGWVKYSGLAETGLGSVICARHSFFLPEGTVNFRKGERYTYADFALGSILSRGLKEGVSRVGIHYDIMCHYIIHFWERMASLQAPLRPLAPTHFQTFLTAIPKFHLAGHTDKCFARYSLNYMPGVGRLDAEGGERCWSNLNQAAGSTSERGPGSRMDALNHVMHQWNWCKTVEMVASICRKWTEACRMAEEQRRAWEDFSQTIDKDLIHAWSQMNTEPRLVNGKWTSVFVLPETPDMSLAEKLRSITESEEVESTATGTLVGGAAWIVAALELEELQQRLRVDINRMGKSVTPRQSQEISARRKALMRRLEAHHSEAKQFCPGNSLDLIEQDNQEMQGKPELLSTVLPSSYTNGSLPMHQSICEKERELRRANCLKALQLLRSFSIQRTHILRSQHKHARGIKAFTRAASYAERIADRQRHAQWTYNHSRKRLERLGMTVDDTKTFLPLRETDIKQLNGFQKDRTALGEGYVKLPWYWRVDLGKTNLQGGYVSSTRENVDQECNNSLRVEWFKARERFKRWEEEVHWLQREAASVILSFQSSSENWLCYAREGEDNGWSAYCHRQHAAWAMLTHESFEKSKHILQNAEGPGSKLCKRVMSLFTAHTSDAGLSSVLKASVDH